MELIMQCWEDSQTADIVQKLSKGQKLNEAESDFIKDKLTMNELAGLK